MNSRFVAAVSGQFTEISRFPVMEGKIWNHPVLAGDILLVLNGREMVAFRLSLTGGQAQRPPAGVSGSSRSM